MSEWVSEWVSEWQGHLLSCFGQLKTPCTWVGARDTCLSQNWLDRGVKLQTRFCGQPKFWIWLPSTEFEHSVSKMPHSTEACLHYVLETTFCFLGSIVFQKKRKSHQWSRTCSCLACGRAPIIPGRCILTSSCQWNPGMRWSSLDIPSPPWWEKKETRLSSTFICILGD